MKSKVIAVVSAMVIAVGSLGVVAYAANAGTVTQKESQLASVAPVNQEKSGNNVEKLSLDVQTQTSETVEKSPNPNSANNPLKDERKDMIKTMQDNGFADAAKYMQTGDYEKMNEFMNNLSEEDFQKMIQIMKDNGYESMVQMMESLGREGMIQMHNSMGSMHGEGNGIGSMHAGGAGMMSGITSAK